VHFLTRREQRRREQKKAEEEETMAGVQQTKDSAQLDIGPIIVQDDNLDPYDIVLIDIGPKPDGDKSIFQMDINIDGLQHPVFFQHLYLRTQNHHQFQKIADCEWNSYYDPEQDALFVNYGLPAHRGSIFQYLDKVADQLTPSLKSAEFDVDDYNTNFVTSEGEKLVPGIDYTPVKFFPDALRSPSTMFTVRGRVYVMFTARDYLFTKQCEGMTAVYTVSVLGADGNRYSEITDFPEPAKIDFHLSKAPEVI
jgi:hypothetical protein